MTLKELREACAKVADDHCLPGTADEIRAIPLPAPDTCECGHHLLKHSADGCRGEAPDRACKCVSYFVRRTPSASSSAPVDDEFARVTKERDEARTELLRVRDVLDEFNDRAKSESACVLEMAQTLRTRRQERDEARAALENELANGPTAEEWRRTWRENEKLRAEVAGLTAALAAAQRERDALSVERDYLSKQLK